MSLIITATDFSAVATNAVDYACNLAVAQNAEVLILHAYIIPVMFSEVAMPTSIVDDAQADAEHQMNELIAGLTNKYPTIKIQGSIEYGDTIDILDDYEENQRPMLIVVGNNTASDASSWLDSTLKDEFKKLKYPVLAVPPQATYKTLHKICFAFDNKHDGNDIALQQLATLATALKAELHVLNTQPDGHNQDNAVEIDATAKTLLQAATPHYHIVYNIQDVDKAIQEFVNTNNIDWLVMIPRKHSFFEGLFHKSHTKAIANTTHIPVVALHERA